MVTPDQLDPQGYWGDPSGNIRRKSGEQDIIATVTDECNKTEWYSLSHIHPNTEPSLQMLLAASMMVQRLRQTASKLIGCCVICEAAGTNINTILDEFATDSKGSTVTQSKIKVGDTL